MSSFANVLFGPDDEIYKQYADRRYPLGQRMFTEDGRIFRFAKAGAATLVPGTILQQRVPITNHVLQTPAAAAVGANTVSVTLGNTAVAINDYQGGHLAVLASNTGEFNAYHIGAHAAVAASGVFVVPFSRGVLVQAAIGTTANSVSLFSNPYFGLIKAPITTRTQPAIAGAVSAIAAGAFGWVQTQGPFDALADYTVATLVVGDQVVSPAGVAGAVGTRSGGGGSTLTVKEMTVGQCMDIGTDTHGCVIYLDLD